ncbi:hypothetical protein M405DRAFT_816984 [Rhizopogon salebrosus TDB-379]|nr:hypothetical protein M405DRAFT_816984 [Rhizopogon salebrosus TDB-379]
MKPVRFAFLVILAAVTGVIAQPEACLQGCSSSEMQCESGWYSKDTSQESDSGGPSSGCYTCCIPVYGASYVSSHN